MVVQHNITAMNANRYFGINNSKLSKSLEKLSSGYAINRAGDNAAGLAVSEKMRSQIAGMTQGVKNAQDGISMVQTFEGALTETDSILQRMKTLADQAAHGTYQDEVDREAIQLEFDQLNDELNQIADTDFNGVVMLNGGQMADGLKAVDGKFDYKAQYDATHNPDGTAISPVKDDVTSYTGETAGTTVTDNSTYGAKAANELWDALGLDVNEYQDIDITFVKDEKGNWNGVMATDKDGNVIEDIDFSKISTEAIDPSATASGKGGFDVKWGDNVLHNVFDAYNSKAGDHLTISFSNTPNTTYAPTHAAVKESSIKGDEADAPNWENGDLTFDIKLGDNVTDENMNTELKSKLDALKDIEFSITYAGGKAVIEGTDNRGLLTVEDDGTGAGVAEVKDADGNVIAKITAKQSGGGATIGATNSNIDAGAVNNEDITVDKSVKKDTYTLEDFGGTKYWVGTKVKSYAFKSAFTDGSVGVTAQKGDTITVSGGQMTAGTFKSGVFNSITDKSSTLGDGEYVFNGVDWTLKDDLVEESKITAAGAAANDTVTVGTVKAPAGKATFHVDLAGYNVADTGSVRCKSVSSNVIDDFQSKLEDAMTKIGVSKSNAYDKATANLTYTDHLIMQVGARSKDAVDFTFSYASEGLGELKANMNCSAREDGLGTANLSLLTAKSANAAIDKIDNAINKVSMVRATFGATQNRLEHKIDNMNVTIENLTSAESRIRDTNMAEEMMNFTKNQILSQASQSMLAQANSLPQGVLQLLQ